MESNLRMIRIPNLFKNICMSDDNLAAVETYQQVIYLINIKTGSIAKKINLNFPSNKIRGLYALHKNILIFENAIIRIDNLQSRVISVPIKIFFIFNNIYIFQDLLDKHQLQHQFGIDQNISSHIIPKIDHKFISNKYQFLRKNFISKFKDNIIEYTNTTFQFPTKMQQGYNHKQFIEFMKKRVTHHIKNSNKFKIIRAHKLKQPIDDFVTNGIKCYFSGYFTEEFKNIIKWRVIQYDLITQQTIEIATLQGVGLKQVICNRQSTLIAHDNKIYVL